MSFDGWEYGLQNDNEQSTSSITNSVSYNNSKLAALNDDMFRRLTPTVVILALMMAVGVVGNGLICYIFIRKLRSSSQKFLLLCLGISDLLSSCVGVPSEIFDIRHYYLYGSTEACKAMRFLTTFPSLASILVLLVIAVDRYRKICKPLHPQIRIIQARISLVIIVIVAFTFAVPAIFIYGHRSFATPIAGLIGCDCSVDDIYKGRSYPLVYEGTFLVAFLIFTIILVSIYLRIWLETRRHIKYLKTHATFGVGLLDEATTTSSTYNYEDSLLENTGDKHSQAKSTNSSVKSLLKKRQSSHSQKKTNTRMLREVDATVGPPEHPAVTYVGVTFHNGEDQLNNETEDSCSWQGNQDVGIKHVPVSAGASKDELQLTILDNSPRSSMKMLKPRRSDRKKVTDTTVDHQVYSKSSVGLPGEPSDSKDVDSSHHSRNRRVNSVSEGVESSHQSRNSRFNSVSETDESNILSTSQQTKLQHQKGNNKISSLSVNSNSDSKTYNDHHHPQSVVINSENNTLQSNHRAQLNDSENKRGSSLKKTSRIKRQTEIERQHIQNGNDSPLQNCDNLNQTLLKKVNSVPEKSEQFSSQRSLHSELSEPGLNHKSKDSKLREKNNSNATCSSYDVETSQRESKSLRQTRSGNLYQEYEDNVSPLSENVDKHKVFPSNTISFLAQSDDTLKSCDNIVDIQSPQFSLKNPIRRSQQSKSNQSLITAKRARKALRATRTTIIAFAITIGFILSYLPHLILMILRSVQTDFEHHLDDAPLNLYNIFIRSYFANNVINVFVYGSINLEFRKQIIHLWRKCKCT